MNNHLFEVKILGSHPNSTSLLIRAGETVIKTEFAELAPCRFPVWTSTPIDVEIPPNGTKDFLVGPFSGSTKQKTSNNDFPTTIRFPIYKTQDVSNMMTFKEFRGVPANGKDANNPFSKVPAMAIATAVSGKLDGEKRIETHCVLPVWDDGTVVLVTLDWFEGEPSEGTPGPEWHMSASAGLPLEVGLKNLEQSSRLPTNTKNCMYHLNFSPWLLGSKLFGDEGKENPHKIWQREWQFTDCAEFSVIFRRIREGLVGTEPSGPPAAA